MAKRITRAAAGKVAVIGIDLGDRYSQACMLDRKGDRVAERRIVTTKEGMRSLMEKVRPCRVVIEAGTLARWVKQALEDLGHEVKVVNPRKMRRIYENESKSDVVDARELADAGLHRWEKLPVAYVRGEVSQEKLAVLSARDALVGSRSMLVNLVRSLLKQAGAPAKKCSTEAFASKAAPPIPLGLRPAVDPLLAEIASLTERIKDLDRWVSQSGERDPAVKLLRQVKGVGPITSAAFVWTIEDPSRFAKSRTVGAFLGMRPRRDQSGETDRQLPITKAGDSFLRRLLVGSAQFILGPFGPDTALRRWGLNLAQRGGKRAKRKAVVAVARKLAVILHHLWITGEVYEPFPAKVARAA